MNLKLKEHTTVQLGLSLLFLVLAIATGIAFYLGKNVLFHLITFLILFVLLFIPALICLRKGFITYS